MIRGESMMKDKDAEIGKSGGKSEHVHSTLELSGYVIDELYAKILIDAMFTTMK